MIVVVLLELSLVVPVVIVFVVELNRVSLHESVEVLVQVFACNDVALDAIVSSSFHASLLVDDCVVDWRLQLNSKKG